jgi:hypothetical protein
MKDVKESCTVKASKDMQSLVKFFHLKKVTETPQKSAATKISSPSSQLLQQCKIDSPNH